MHWYLYKSRQGVNTVPSSTDSSALIDTFCLQKRHRQTWSRTMSRFALVSQSISLGGYTLCSFSGKNLYFFWQTHLPTSKTVRECSKHLPWLIPTRFMLRRTPQLRLAPEIGRFSRRNLGFRTKITKSSSGEPDLRQADAPPEKCDRLKLHAPMSYAAHIVGFWSRYYWWLTAGGIWRPNSHGALSTDHNIIFDEF